MRRMRFDKTGKVAKNFYILGSPHVPVYLLDGAAPVLFDAGLTALADIYVEEAGRVLNGRSPAYLCLTHSHFDHVGSASRLKAAWPEMRIIGSPKVDEVMGRPGAVDLITALNREGAEYLSYSQEGVYKIHFEPFTRDGGLGGGEVIELGSGRIEVIHTPGHTWDFMSYWIPEESILIASEAAGGSDARGYVFAEFLVDFDAYRRSLEALSLLGAQVLCPGHWVVMTGEDVAAHMDRSLQYAAEYVAAVEEWLRLEEGDIERTALRVKAFEWDPRPWPKQPEPAYLLNTQARVKAVRERMQRA